MPAPADALERLIADLAAPGVLPGSDGAPVEIVQTHISVVFLTADRAYKLKKPVDFGFLDFSTPELRARYCREEFRLNRRLAPDAYLGLAPVHLRPTGVVVGEPVASPPPADELLVVMVRLPAERMLDRMLAEGTVEPRHIERIARVVASFHRRVDAGPEVARFGTREAVGRLALENFDQTESFVGELFPAQEHRAMRARTAAFLETHERLFALRIDQHRIRDGHGDLHSPNICIVGDEPVIYDCIEFSPAYRAVDVASEVGFLAMDLEYRGRPDLAELLVKAYRRESEDESLTSLLPFYIVYRAMVRAKISALTASADEVDLATREAATESARRFFELAREWSEGLVPPALILIGGPIGSGRRAIGERLAARAGLPLLDSAEIRGSLAGIPRERVDAAADDALFSESVTRATYRTLGRHARRALEGGQAALVVGNFFQPEHRQAVLDAARAVGVPALLVMLDADDEELARRLGPERARGLCPGYRAQRRAAEPGLASGEDGFAGTIRMAPAEDPSEAVHRVLEALRALAGAP